MSGNLAPEAHIYIKRISRARIFRKPWRSALVHRPVPRPVYLEPQALQHLVHLVRSQIPKPYFPSTATIGLTLSHRLICYTANDHIDSSCLALQQAHRAYLEAVVRQLSEAVRRRLELPALQAFLARPRHWELQARLACSAASPQQVKLQV